MQNTKGIDPNFFRQSAVDATAYKLMLRYYGLHHIEQLQGAPIFQQDGTPADTSRIVTEYSQRNLGDRWISKRGPVNWPPRSPDLTPLDFFLWGYVKDKVYSEEIYLLSILSLELLRQKEASMLLRYRMYGKT